MTRRGEVLTETLEERWLREALTARNLEGMVAEQEGRWDDAVALYERNVADGFQLDWPYGRLCAIYERRGDFSEAERVLLRGIEVFRTARLRTPSDRRAMAATFRRRLTLVRKRSREARQA